MIPKEKYLIKQAFQNLNAMKRFQTQEEIERQKGRTGVAEQYELKKLKSQFRLELSLRAIQKEIYNDDSHEDDESDDHDDNE